MDFESPDPDKRRNLENIVLSQIDLELKGRNKYHDWIWANKEALAFLFWLTEYYLFDNFHGTGASPSKKVLLSAEHAAELLLLSDAYYSIYERTTDGENASSALLKDQSAMSLFGALFLTGAKTGSFVNPPLLLGGGVAGTVFSGAYTDITDFVKSKKEDDFEKQFFGYHTLSNLNNIVKRISYNSRIASLLSVSYFNSPDFQDFINEPSQLTQTIGSFLLPWYQYYIGPKLLNEYVYERKNRKIIPLQKEDNILKKGYYSILNNKELTSMFLGAVAGYASYVWDKEGSSLEKSLFYFNTLGILSDLSLSFLKQSERLKSHYTQKRKHHSENLSPKGKFDFLWEHPTLAVLIASSATFVKQGLPVLEYDLDLATKAFSIAWPVFLAGLIGGISYTMIGSALHSESVNEVSKAIQSEKNALYASFLKQKGKTQKGNDFYEKAIQSRKSILQDYLSPKTSMRQHVALSRLYIRMGNHLEDALEEIRITYELREEEGKQISLRDFFGQLSFFDKAVSTIQELNYSRHSDLESQINLALTKVSSGKIKESERIFEAAYKQLPNFSEIGILYASIKYILGQKKEGDELLQAVFEKNYQTFEYDSLGESANDVYTLAGTQLFENTFIFKSNKDAELLKEEERITKNLDALVNTHSEYETTRPITITQAKIDDVETNIYVMRRSSGKTLLELIESENVSEVILEENFNKIVKYLALIHARLPVADKNRTKINLKEKAVERIIETKTANCIEYANKISLNYEPIITALNDSNLVFNKDAHPDNWLITRYDKILALDNENKGAVCQQIDLANLLEYTEYPLGKSRSSTQADKSIFVNQMINEYIFFYNSFSDKCKKINKEDKPSFKLAYYNSVIHRALSYSGFLSSKPQKQKYIVSWLDNALHAIDLIEKDFSSETEVTPKLEVLSDFKRKGFYNLYSEQYSSIKEVLTNLKFDLAA